MGQRRIKDRAKKKNRRLARRRRRRMKRLLGLVLGCSILTFGIVYGFLSHYVSKHPQDKICNNIFIGSANVSGMTKKEALAKMDTLLEKNQKVKVVMKVGKKESETTLEELGIQYKDMKKTVETAYNYGKKGSLWRKYRSLHKLSKEKLILDEGYVLKKKTAAAVLNAKAVPLANHAVNASMTKTPEGFDIKGAKKGETVDIDKSLAAIQKKLNNKWNYKELSVKMTLKEELPAVRKKDLETVTDKLGTFSTDAGGGERIQNLRTGAKKLNGLVIAPGQEVSVHDVTAPYDAESGYVAAGSYENGQVVETYGGGICQVSTTLYNALLYAELEITERYPHSMLVAYVEPSRDAAIAGDVKDLKFKNNYKTPIYIEGFIDGENQLTFTVYGKETRKEGRTVEYESETLSTEEYGRTYKADPSAPLGSIEYEGSPHTGKTARLWKIVKENGKQVSRDVVNNSTYQKSDEILVVGTKSENGAASGIVDGAIATQDREKINAAISKARTME